MGCAISAARCAICVCECASDAPSIDRDRARALGFEVRARLCQKIRTVWSLHRTGGDMRSSFAKFSILTWGGAALSLVLSCSSKAEDSTGFSAAGDFCQRWLDVAAVASARCLGASEPAIRAFVGQFTPCLDVSASLSTLHLKYDSHFADACLAETQAVTCSQGLSASTACGNVFVGEVPVGGSCSPLAFADLSECAPGNQCSISALCAGSCVPFAKLGEACGGATGKNCDLGLSCDLGMSVCVKAAAQGDTCSFNQPCSGNLVCEGASGPVGFVTDASTQIGTCKAKPDSGPCYFDDNCSNRCVGASPPDSLGQCKPRPALGEACAPGAKECALGAYCGVGERCISLPSLGQSCVGNSGEGSECLDSYCDPTTAMCVAFLQSGDPCSLSSAAYFPPDPCGGFRLVCDSGYCAPTCLSAQQCGRAGEACCEHQQCSAGSICVSGRCSVAG